MKSGPISRNPSLITWNRASARNADSASSPYPTNRHPERGRPTAAEQPYGEGSASAATDGSAPEGYAVKGDVNAMTYYEEDSAGYEDARAEVWFLSPAHAEAAGFRAPRRSRR